MTTSLNPFQQAVANLEAQAKADLLVPANSSLDKIISTPNTQNVILQWPVFTAQLTALLPILEGQGIVDLATAIKTWLNSGSVLASTPASNTTPAA